MVLKTQSYYVGVEMRVYPRFRLVNYDPVVIETEKGYLSVSNPSEARLLLLVAHMPGADVEKIAWSYVVSSGEENIDNTLMEAYELVKELAKKGLILVI